MEEGISMNGALERDVNDLIIANTGLSKDIQKLRKSEEPERQTLSK